MRQKKAGRKINWSYMIMFSLPERVCPEISRKEGRFHRHADLFQLDYFSVFFIRMRPLHRNEIPVHSSLKIETAYN